MKLRQLKPNQAELVLNGVVIFFSYNTPVAALVGAQAYRTEQKYSVTTSKHLNAWLGDRKVQIVAQEFINGLVEGKTPQETGLFGGCPVKKSEKKLQELLIACHKAAAIARCGCVPADFGKIKRILADAIEKAGAQ